MRRTLTCMASALLLGAIPYSLASDSATPDILAEIRWTAWGIPHIQARTERGLGYGIGYAYARDNLCLLAEEMVTARGERARYFGANAQSSARIDNIPSDIFFRWLNDEPSIQKFWAAQPEAVQHRLEGYAAGFNRYLRDLPEDQRPKACAGREWLRPIEASDLLRLMRRLTIESGLGQFIEALIKTAPPDLKAIAHTEPDQEQPSSSALLARLEAFGQTQGSNAVAIGGQLSANGKGLLLANPHFPWQGALRFYQMHLTIPGQLDVMGAALAGMPVINIGFNAHVAWTHTVDASRHFTLHRLALDPEHPGHYRIDNQYYPLVVRKIPIEVREEDGQITTLEHSLYLSQFGPLLVLPNLLDWTAQTAFALQDANFENARAIQQWMAIDQASSLGELRQHIEHIQGIPWVNTVAADDQGNTLYLNVSVMPNVTPEQLKSCLDPALRQRLPVLDGSRSACHWTVVPGTPQPGMVPARELPALERRDFVQNSNDSAWLTNPAAPLTGFSPWISRELEPLRPRTQFALSQLPYWKSGSVQAQKLEQLVTDNRVYLADLVMDDLLALCQDPQAPQAMCHSFQHWDRRANVDTGLGPVYFRYFMTYFQNVPSTWRTPFDPQAPATTPRGIAIDDPQVRAQVLQMMQSAAEEVTDSGLDKAETWGAIQIATRGQQSIAIPGASGRLGVYNAIESQPIAGGHLEVTAGSSYLQLVQFEKEGPKARGLLSFSQSTNPDSPHFADQTQLFSQQVWQPLPFTEDQIQAATPSPVLRLSEESPKN